MTVFPMQHLDTHSVHHPEEVKIYPGASQLNQIIPISLSTSVLQNHLARQKNMVGSTINPQPLAGVPVLTPVSVLPSKSSVVGTTDLRYFTYTTIPSSYHNSTEKMYIKLCYKMNLY